MKCWSWSPSLLQHELSWRTSGCLLFQRGKQIIIMPGVILSKREKGEEKGKECHHSLRNWGDKFGFHWSFIVNSIFFCHAQKLWLEFMAISFPVMKEKGMIWVLRVASTSRIWVRNQESNMLLFGVISKEPLSSGCHQTKKLKPGLVTEKAYL